MRGIWPASVSCRIQGTPIALFLAALVSSLCSVSQTLATQVGGVICSDTVWDLASSPFSVTSNVFVCEGTTLTIEPGVVVQFNGKGMRVDGKLIGQGTQTQRISLNGGQGISFTNLSVDAVFDHDGQYTGGSILQFCTVDGGGIEIKGASPFIDHCTIQNSAAAGIRYTCSGANDDALRLTSLRLTNNRILGNGTGLLNDICGVGGLGGPFILGNVFTGNTNQAVNMMSDVQFSHNLVIDDRGVTNERGTISQNLFSGIIPAGGAAVSAGGSPYEVSHNVFVGNSGTVALSIQSSPLLENTFANNQTNGVLLSVAEALGVHGNHFFGNSGFNLKYTGFTTLNAENNWWGTDDPAAIEDKIVHFIDDLSLGLVDFQPFITDPGQDTAVTPTTLDFGAVTPGETQDLPVTVKNQGTDELIVYGAVRDSLDYEILSPVEPQHLAPDQEVTFSVRFAPGTADPSTGKVYILSNDPDQPVIEIPVAGNLVCNGLPVTVGCTVNGAPNQLCVGTAGSDTIIGTAGNDVILGLAGNDTLKGKGGNDTLCGGAGKDSLYGGAGADTLLGDQGKDSLFGGGGKDTLLGGPGNDTLDGEAGKDSLNGGGGTDNCGNGELIVNCEP